MNQPAQPPRPARFPSAARLTRRREFERVRREGKRQVGRLIIFNYLATGSQEEARIGIITSRRVGKAVARNKIRRRLREISRKHRHELQKGLHLVIVAREKAAAADYPQIEDEWLRLAKAASIVCRSS